MIMITSPMMNFINFAVGEAMRGEIRKQYRGPGRQRWRQLNEGAVVAWKMPRIPLKIRT